MFALAKKNTDKTRQSKQICTLHIWHQWLQVQSGCFRGVLKRLSHITKPHHTSHTAQIHQPSRQTSNLQEEHISYFNHCLLSHLQLQVRAYLCGTTISPATNQDLTTHSLHIINTFFGLYCSQVGASTCPGPVHLCVLTLYLVAHVLRRPCLFVIENKQDFCW